MTKKQIICQKKQRNKGTNNMSKEYDEETNTMSGENT